MTKKSATTSASAAAAGTAGDPSPVELSVVPTGDADLLPVIDQRQVQHESAGIPNLVGPDIAVSPAGFTIRCGRPQGIWRAGRFWPPESVSVPADELTEEQLQRLIGEPLLAVTPYLELGGE